MTVEELLRRYVDGERNFRNVELNKCILRGVVLNGINLCKSYLYKVDFSWAILRGAKLCDTDLRNADLRGSDLCGVDFSGAYLRGANLRGADIRGANLRGADLTDTNLVGTYLGVSKRFCTIKMSVY